MKEEIPSLSTLVQDVNTAYEQLTKLLESWRDSRIAALQKCHALVVKQVDAFLEQTAQHVLDPATSSTPGPLEKYLHTAGGELNLMKAQIKRSEAALAKACVVWVESELDTVETAFSQEELALEAQKNEECAILQKEVALNSAQSEKYKKPHEEVEESLKMLLQEYYTEIEKLQQQASDNLKLALTREAECTDLNFALSSANKDRENFAQKSIDLRRELANVSKEKVILQTKAIETDKKLSEKEAKIEDLQNQLNMATSSHFGERAKPVREKHQTVIAEELCLEDSDTMFELPSKKPKYKAKRVLPPVRKSSRNWDCPECTVKNSFLCFICRSCKSPRPKWTCANCKSENEAQVDVCPCGIIRESLLSAVVSLSPRNSKFRYQIFDESEEVEQRFLSRPFTAFTKSPRTTILKIPTGGVDLSPRSPQKPEEEKQAEP